MAICKHGEFWDPKMGNNPLACDDVYVRNMTALFRSNATLAQQIDECVEDGSVLIEPSKRGAPTVSVPSADSGHRLYLHSRVDPQGEAKRFVESTEIGESFCYVVSGFGLGHHIRALYDQLKGDAFIIVTEPNLQLIRAAMETVDLADVLANDRCIILTRTDKGALQSALEPHNTLMMMGAQFVSHPPSERVNAEFHSTMRKLIADHMTYCRMCLVTLVANSRITCKNIAFNLPTYLSTPGIDALRDRFKGYPGIIVSAGPSLQRNIDRLADLKGKAVICAVQATFKTLLDLNIEPDFVTALDYHEMSKRFFENFPYVSDTHLIAEPKVTWHVVDCYRGPISLLNNDFARLCVGDALSARGGLKAGATVAHLAFYLAVYLGCDPVIFVGQDLGYTGNVYYAPGVAIKEMWRPDFNRFCTIEMKEWERIVRSRSILMKVKDIHGRDMYTDEQLFTYLQQFEGDFSVAGVRVIDATEGGVRKAGTQIMTLAEAANKFCQKPISPELFAYRRQLNWHDTSRLRAGRDKIEQRIKEVDRLVETCERIITLLKEMTDLLDKPLEFNRRIADVDALRVKIRQQDHTYKMVSSVSQHAELQRFSADRRLGLTELDSVSRARRQLERDIRFVEAMIDGAGVLCGILNGSLERFKAAIDSAETKEDQSDFVHHGGTEVTENKRN